MKKKLFTLFLFITYLSFSQSLGLITTDLNSRKSPGGEKLRVIQKNQIVEILKSSLGLFYIYIYGDWFYAAGYFSNINSLLIIYFILSSLVVIYFSLNERKISYNPI